MKHPPVIYAVAWPADLILKSGYSTEFRWEQFVQRGATVLRLYEFRQHEDLLAFNFEQILHDLAAYKFDLAFESRAESLPWLGQSGQGYRECRKLGSADDLAAWRAVLPSNAYEALLELGGGSPCMKHCPYGRTYGRT